IQGFKTFQYSPTQFWTKVVSFVPEAPAVVQESALGGNRPLPSYLRLRQAMSGGGVIATGAEEAKAISFAPALWGDIGASPGVAVGGGAIAADTEWAQSRGLGRSNAARRSYTTVDAAAVAILREMVPISNKFNREFGGSICRNAAGRYFPLEPIEGS